MGVAILPKDVKLFSAIMFHDENVLDQVKATLTELWGPIEVESAIFDFTHSDYYLAEMGADLKKQFIVFLKMVPPDFLVAAKLITNEIEQKHLKNGRRQVNLDPGYISAAKVVLATTKDYVHRIYLGRGIYGDVHLKSSKRQLVPNEWTYPDYKMPQTIAFFDKVRKDYLELIANQSKTLSEK